MKIDGQIDIVFAIDEGYVDQLIVTAYSVVKNNKTFSVLRFYVIHNGLDLGSRQRIKRLEKFHDTFVDFIEIDDTRFYDFPSNIKHISPIAYSRFLAAELLPTLKKVLYLDADIIVLGDLAGLWQTKLDGRCVAGSHKPYINKQFPGYKQSIGLAANATYINSGVMLMNLSRMRALNKTEELLLNAHRLRDIVRIQDQDIINITFRGQMSRFHKRYNYTDSDRRKAQLKPSEIVVVHFNTRNKPWRNDFIGDRTNQLFAKQYLEYRRETTVL